MTAAKRFGGATPTFEELAQSLELFAGMARNMPASEPTPLQTYMRACAEYNGMDPAKVIACTASMVCVEAGLGEPEIEDSPALADEWITAPGRQLTEVYAALLGAAANIRSAAEVMELEAMMEVGE